MPVDHPRADAGREDLDFGRGFYLTRIKGQAENWAKRVQLIRASEQACISEYSLDLEQAIANEYNFLMMERYDREWLDFIVDSRAGKRPWAPYDIIEGGVANDRVIDTVENYINGDITAEQALGQLIYKKPNHQLCILNQAVIDKYLIYKSHQII